MELDVTQTYSALLLIKQHFVQCCTKINVVNIQQYKSAFILKTYAVHESLDLQRRRSCVHVFTTELIRHLNWSVIGNASRKQKVKNKIAYRNLE